MLSGSLPLLHLWNFLLPLSAPDRILLPSWLSLPVSFIKVLPLPKKFNRFHHFRFHIPVCNSCDWLSTRFHRLQVTLLGLLGSATCQHVQQPQQTKKEPTVTTSRPLLATVKPRTLISWQYWWYITPMISR